MEYKKTDINSKGISQEVSDFVDKDKNVSLYKEDLKNVDLNNTREANQLESFILDRISAMKTNKDQFTQDLANADLAYEAKTDIIIDGKPFVNIPLEQGMIDNMEGELGERDIVYKVEPIGNLTDVNKVQPNTIVMDYLYGEDNTSEKMRKFRSHFLKYGFSVVFEGQQTEKRIIRSNNEKFDGIFLKGSTDIKKEVWNMTLGSRVVLPKNFFIDDTVLTYREAGDCVEIEQLGKYDVLSQFDGKEYFNKTRMVDSLKDKDNEIAHYWNIRRDIYAITVNNVLIYEGANPYEHKQLPYSVAVMKENDKSVYGSGGIVKMLRFAKPYINEVFNITLQQSKNSVQAPIIIGNGGSFDGQEPRFGIGGMWKMSGSVQELKELKVSPPDGAIFNIISILEDFIVQVIGVDLRSIYSKGNKTKFEVGLIDEAKNKRLEVYSKSLDYAYSNFLNQRLKNAHQLLSIIAIEEIVDPNSIKKAGYKKILLKDTTINQLEDGSSEFDVVPGAYAEFELTPEQIRGTFNVKIVTESTKPILKEIAKQDIIDANNQTMALLNTMQSIPEAASIVNFKGMIDQVYTSFGIDPKNVLIDTNSQRISDKIATLKEKAIAATQQMDVNPQDQMMNGIVNGQTEQPQDQNQMVA